MAGRSKASWTVVVQRKPGEVFDYLADPRRHSEWSPKAYRVEGLADGPVSVGTTFTSYGWIPGDKEHRNDVTVTELMPPTRLVLTSTERGEQFVNTFVLAPEGDGTRVTREMDTPTPGGLLGLVYPMVLAGFIKPAVQRGMNMLKDRLENQGQP